MHSKGFLLTCAFMASCALAAPLTQPDISTKGSFRVEFSGRHRRSGHDALAHAYAKYGWKPHWDSSDSSNVSQGSTNTSASSGNSTTGGTGTAEEGEVTATPEQNASAYVAPVNIGGQVMNLDFDTGSSDLWVFSTLLAAGTTGGHTLFDPAKSSSFENYTGSSWETQYGDGSSASGVAGFDTVTIGGATVQKQCVELAAQTSGFNNLQASDGLLGLGFSTINQVKPEQQKTFWENILDQLDQPLFTADLEDTAAGSYEFGSIDTSKFTGDIHYTPVDSSVGYWMIQSTAFSVNGQTQQCSDCSPLIADTGTSLLLLDQDVVEAYYNQVESAQFDQSQGLFVYSCDATLPDFGLAIGDYMAVLSGSGLKYAESGNGQCLGGLQWNGGGGLSIAGDVFMRQYFTVFDAGNTQLGVAPKSGS